MIWDKASCPSLINLSSTPMYLFCRAMLSRLASASCRAFSFAFFSLRASNISPLLYRLSYGIVSAGWCSGDRYTP